MNDVTKVIIIVGAVIVIGVGIILTGTGKINWSGMPWPSLPYQEPNIIERNQP